MDFGGIDVHIVNAVFEGTESIEAVVGVAGKSHGPNHVVRGFDDQVRRQ